jgi:hypothetical protein
VARDTTDAGIDGLPGDGGYVFSMNRTALKLVCTAGLTTLVFIVCELLLGYLVSSVLELHVPLPGRSELTVLAIGLMYTAPLIFGLTLLGLAMAWSDALAMPARSVLAQALLGGLLFAVLFTLEELPRQGALWLVLILPIAVIAAAFASTRLLAARARARLARQPA